MCGIVGVINRSKVKVDGDKLRGFFKEALFCDMVRGKHGTGVIGVDGKGIVETYKRGLSAPDFLQLSKTNDIIEDATNKFLIGHNRWATQGAHSCENAHPFSHSHIHLVHNGTLDFYKGLTPGVNFNVDSEAIAYLLSVSATPKEALEQLQGAYSLVWYDSSNESINFARNTERPMYFAQVKDSKSLLFASEDGMIKWLASRKTINLEEVVSLKTGIILSIPLDESKTHSITDFTVKESTKNDYYTSYGRGSYRSNHVYSDLDGQEIEVKVNGWKAYNNNTTAVPKRGSLTCSYLNRLPIEVGSILEEQADDLILAGTIIVKVTSIPTASIGYAKFIGIAPTKTNVIHLTKTDDSNQKFFVGPKEKMISMKEFKERTKNGCSNCSGTIYSHQHRDLLWDSNDEVYCVNCTNAMLEV